MWRKPKYIEIRNKQDADDFIDYAIENGDKFAEKLRIPEEIAGKKLKVDYVQWKKKLKRFMVIDEDTNKIYAVHPSSINFKYFDSN